MNLNPDVSLTIASFTMKSYFPIIFVHIYLSLQTFLSSDAFTLNSAYRCKSTTAISLFRELITDDDEDLRADITTIVKQDGLKEFLHTDDRLCVIKLYAPFCKACKAFGVKFRKLAIERGDRINAAGEVVRPGIARFGEIEYSSNIKLCRYLEVKKFPTVLIYDGGQGKKRVGEIDCRNISIESLLSEMDQVMNAIK